MEGGKGQFSASLKFINITELNLKRLHSGRDDISRYKMYVCV